MSVSITFNGVAYTIPNSGDQSWGGSMTNFFTAIPQGALQKTAGSFPLSADVDFGTNFGVLSKYFQTRTTLPALSGLIRLSLSDSIAWRNNANTGDLTLAVNASDQLTYQGVEILVAGNYITSLTGDVTASGPGAAAATIASGVIVDSMVSATSAIAYSKLALATSIVNSDISLTAAIAYSKLALSGSILNADISASAAIAYSKLSLGSSILNTDISASAAIARSKLASGTVGQVVINDGSTGLFSSEAQLAITRGGTGQANSTAAFNALSPVTTKGDLIVGDGTNSATRLAIGSDGQVPIGDSTQSTGIRWATLQQGSKNYIANPNFENNSTSGWSLFNTTLTSLVPTGSITAGATSITTFAVTTTNPLAGTYSLNVASTGALTAGQGIISDAFTIDAEDSASVLASKFFYGVVSGALNLDFSGTSSNTWQVYWYDVTNSKWVQGAGVYNLTGNIAKGNPPSIGTVQLDSSCTQARLALICINASSGASSLVLDDFSVGPQTLSMGPAMSDWTGDTFTLGGSTSAPSGGGTVTATRRYRRVGSSLEIEFTWTDTAAGTDGSGDYLFPLPSGKSLDITNIVFNTADTSLEITSGATLLGYGHAFFNTSTHRIAGIVSAYDANHLILSVGDITLATYGNLKNAGSSWFQLSGGAVEFYIKASVPIAGWSSNTAQSSDVDNRLLAASTNSTPTSSAFDGSVNIIFATMAFDKSASYNTSTGEWKVPSSGPYLFSGQLGITGTSVGTVLDLNLQVGGVTQATFNPGTLATGAQFVSLSKVLDLKAGNLVTLKWNTDKTSPAITGGTTRNNLNIYKLQGPAIVQASSTVGSKFKQTAGQVLSAGTIVNFDTLVYDKTGSVTTGSSWKFTAPVSGLYRVSGALEAASGSGAFSVYKNGTSDSALTFLTTTQTMNSGTTTLQLVAGDFIDVRAAGTTTLSTSGVNNQIEIERVGNY